MSEQCRQQLAGQLAEAVAEALRADLATQARALLVLSGGSTPVPFFQALAACELPWERIEVTLADERWVAEDATDSNARLVREHLLKGPAAQATFVPLDHRRPDSRAGSGRRGRAASRPWPGRPAP